MPGRRRVGVYVHVPFCERVCPYCDFAVVAAPRGLAAEPEERYVAALLRELAQRAGAFAGLPLASLYFGGGTPSLLRPESLARVVEAVRAVFADDGPAVEVTLEANPGSLDRARLPALRAIGIDRLSLGVQSFDDSLLKALGRAHRADECRSSLAAARDAGFENVSLDLLFGGLHQTGEMLERDLDAIAALAPEHVSTYELVIEPGTPFAKAEARGQIRALDQDVVAERMQRIEARLAGCGFAHYELQNYARPGRESVHNRLYWSRTPVLGLGVGAHSTDPPSEARPFGARPANPRSLAEYLARVEAGGPAEASVELLDERMARGEALFLGLRRGEGVAAAAFAAEFAAPPSAFFGAEIEALVATGLLAESPAGDLRLTAAGRLLADTVFAHFV